MRLRFLIFFCALFPLLAGWGHWGPQAKVGFAVDNAEIRQTLIQSFKDELADNRGDLLMEDAKGDPALQEKQVEDLIAQGVQALVVIPVNPTQAAPLVKAAHKAAIKVISLDSLIPDSGLDYLIAFNEEKSGAQQAGAMVKRVPRGDYVLLGETGGLRKGQLKELQPLIDRGDIRIAASRLSGGGEKEIEAVLKAEGQKVDAILVSDRTGLEEAVEALDHVVLTGKIQIAGMGEDLETCRRIAAGTQALTIYHPPKKLAAEAAYLAAKLARKATQFDCQFTDVDNGGTTTKAVLLTPTVVDAQNLDSTVISDGVQKREEVYGK